LPLPVAWGEAYATGVVTRRRYLGTVHPIISRRSSRPYRRRRPLPALVLLVVLAATGVVVWAHVLHKAADSTVQANCPASAAAPVKLPILKPLPYPALDNVTPVPAAQVKVHTLNSSSQVGLADRIALQLHQNGFAQAGTPGNDPYHPSGDMRCFGQIRFGANGAAAARTLSLVVPCAQLIRDNRQDASVDLALGTYFTDLAPSQDALTVLSQLATWAHGHPSSGGGLQSQAAQAPTVAPGLLAAAHTFRC
jgi:hypothetical protein